MDKKYIIIPGCCDLNRGDQALGWETKKIAEDAGFVGQYCILAEKGEPIEQSKKEGYEILLPILEHPSRNFKDKNNIKYSFGKKIKWGCVAIKDFIFSYLLLFKTCRAIYMKFSKNEYKKKSLKIFEESDAVFMKGGGVIQSHGGILSTYATYYRLYHIFLAHRLKKSVYILPNSFGPFEGPFVKLMVKKAFSKCKLVTAREKKTQEVVKEDLNLKIECFPDLAFFLENGSINRLNLCKNLNLDSTKKIVAITMRPYRFPNSENPKESYEVFKKEMRKFIIWLNRKGYIPLIVEHTFAITSHESDGSCIKDVISDLNSNEYVIFSNKDINCRELKSLYGCCDYVIGTRFHSMIFSLSNMIPGIAISYDGYKSIGIMRDMGLEEYVIDISNVTSDLLIEKFNKIILNEEVIKTNIKNYINEAKLERAKLISMMKG